MKKNKAFPYTLNPDEIPTAKVLDITPECGCAVHVNYACPNECWREHLEAWRRECRKGNLTAPDPMPYGHLMFERPVSYGCIPYGCTDPTVIRAAHEQHVRGSLHGWDRDLTSEQLDKIVNATVEARMRGEDVGAFPFIACIAVGLE